MSSSRSETGTGSRGQQGCFCGGCGRKAANSLLECCAPITTAFLSVKKKPPALKVFLKHRSSTGGLGEAGNGLRGCKRDHGAGNEGGQDGDEQEEEIVIEKTEDIKKQGTDVHSYR